MQSTAVQQYPVSPHAMSKLLSSTKYSAMPKHSFGRRITDKVRREAAPGGNFSFANDTKRNWRSTGALPYETPERFEERLQRQKMRESRVGTVSSSQQWPAKHVSSVSRQLLSTRPSAPSALLSGKGADTVPKPVTHSIGESQPTQFGPNRSIMFAQPALISLKPKLPSSGAAVSIVKPEQQWPGDYRKTTSTFGKQSTSDKRSAPSSSMGVRHSLLPVPTQAHLAGPAAYNPTRRTFSAVGGRFAPRASSPNNATVKTPVSPIRAARLVPRVASLAQSGPQSLADWHKRTPGTSSSTPTSPRSRNTPSRTQRALSMSSRPRTVAGGGRGEVISVSDWLVVHGEPTDETKRLFNHTRSRQATVRLPKRMKP